MSYAVRAEGLVKRYGTTVALDGVGLTVRPGEVVALLGPNGAGKTTALRVLATLARPDAGRATVCGHDVVRERARVRELIGATGWPAGGGFGEGLYGGGLEGLDGLEGLRGEGLYGEPSWGGPDEAARGGGGREARARAGDLLERFELTGAVGRPVGTLSDGVRRGLELVARLLGGPRVLLLDEPDRGLDPRARRTVRDVVRQLAAEGKAVLFTTQHPGEADGLADRVTLLDDGRVVAEGRPEELKRRIGEPSLRVRPSLAGDGDAVGRILTELTGTGPSRDRHTGLLSVPASDPMLLSALVRRLERAGIGTEDLGLCRPGLEDVVATLTGGGSADQPAARPARRLGDRPEPGSATGSPTR
ncbi:ATP-binding cassette domain-containing protein [Streptomyces sp. NPDC048370]|uniref:ATP-binding cassette domain-containing protein n=1 Tax=Streptomyces sp. NPDC048370 TaxID=3365540 RepID=UPI00371F373C